jgi:hypothetical protein
VNGLKISAFSYTTSEGISPLDAFTCVYIVLFFIARHLWAGRRELALHHCSFVEVSVLQEDMTVDTLMENAPAGIMEKYARELNPPFNLQLLHDRRCGILQTCPIHEAQVNKNT